jgi:uncharacterized protein
MKARCMMLLHGVGVPRENTTINIYFHVSHAIIIANKKRNLPYAILRTPTTILLNKMPNTLDDLRHLAVMQTLFRPTTLKLALRKFGFVQADPIRSPARAQDLILRHRVNDYRAGDLERNYEKLGVEEDFFINYGFVTKSVQALMHPRIDCRNLEQSRMPWPTSKNKRDQLLLDFVRERGEVHPRDADDHFAHGKVENYWGGNSNATTHLLDAMHYQGLLRVVRRENGIRVYAIQDHGPGPSDDEARRARLDALIDVAVRIYAPLPQTSLMSLVRRTRAAAPQWEDELARALQRAKERLSRTRVGETDWYWLDEKCVSYEPPDIVRLLAPFDPIVWDRRRFELLWGWTYRFEAYTPVGKRKLGYYAMPLLWRDRVIGWGNLSVKNGDLKAEFGYVKPPPKDRAFKRELEAELDRIKIFLGLEPSV